MPHELDAVQSTSHSQALLQSTTPSQEPLPQVMLHLPGPHAIGPVQACWPAQVSVQTSAAVHMIAPSQESWPQVIVEAAPPAAIEPLHDCPFMHVIVQASVASHLTAMSHESAPQVTVHALPPQSTRPSQDCPPVQPIVQLDAAVQLTSPWQLSCPLHLTSHGTSGGQMTPASHELVVVQSNVQVPLWQVPPAAMQVVPHSRTGRLSGGASITSGGGPSDGGASSVTPAGGAL